MSVTRDKNTGKWMSQIRVKDWTGKEIHKKKRGFKTKKRSLAMGTGFYQSGRWQPWHEVQRFRCTLYEGCRSSSQRNDFSQQALSVQQESPPVLR